MQELQGVLLQGAILSKDYARVSCTPPTPGSRSVFAIPKRIAGAQYLTCIMRLLSLHIQYKTCEERIASKLPGAHR